MSIMQFAVASLVDANTGYQRAQNGANTDYEALTRHGRTVRAKSVNVLFGLIAQRLGSAVASLRQRAVQHRQLATLQQLDDHLLRDIGLSREDIHAVELGQLTLEQLQAQHREQSADSAASVDVDTELPVLSAANEAIYHEAKCA